MDQLTPLERELLVSVEQLVSGCRSDTAALRAALSDYATQTSDAMEQRLQAIEQRQARLEQALGSLATQLADFGRRWSQYEDSLTSLSGVLSKLRL